MAIVVPVVSTWNGKGLDKAVAEIKRAQTGFGKFTAGMNIAAASMQKTGQTLTRNVTAPLIAVGYAAKKAADAAVIDQKAQVQLAQTMRNVAKSTDVEIASMEKFVSKMQMAYGVSDTELRPALATLMRVTKDVTKSQSLTSLAMDISAGSGRDLASVSLGLAKAYGGNFTALQRLGIVIPENIKKSKDLGKMTEYLNGVFGGQAKAAADTYAGRMAILRERMSEVQEDIGYALLPVLSDLLNFINTSVVPAIERFANWFKGLSSETKTTILQVGAFVAALGPMLIITGKLFGAFNSTITAMKTMNSLFKLVTAGWTSVAVAETEAATAATVAGTAMKRALIGTGIGAIVVGIGYIAEKLWATAQTADQTNASLTKAFSGAKVTQINNMNMAIATTVPYLNGVALAATRAGDAVENAALRATKSDIYKKTPDPKPVVVGYQDIANALGGAKGAKSTKPSVATAAETASKAIGDFKASLDDVKNKLQDAKSAFADYASGVSSSITGVIDFSQAATAETGTFLENLLAQAAKAKDFGGKVQQLLSMGLSQSAIGQVLSAGADAGTKIADEIIAGGASVVNQVNTLLDATQSLADQVGAAGASQFYSAGIAQGEAMVQGVMDAITRAGFSVNAGGEIVNQKAIDTVNAQLAAFKKSGGKLTKKEKAKITNLANSLGVDVPMMAKGGIVTAPTFAMVGEAGPEAIVPLDRAKGLGGNTYNLVINAGMGTDGALVGREIVDAIKRYERASGPVFASA